MNPGNPYEYLKIDTLADTEPVEAKSTWHVAVSSDESVTIFSSPLTDGTWVYGYIVNWASGRVSMQRPSAALGRFHSQREAKLYAVAFMLLYKAYFLASTVASLTSAEGALIQSELF